MRRHDRVPGYGKSIRFSILAQWPRISFILLFIHLLSKTSEVPRNDDYGFAFQSGQNLFDINALLWSAAESP